VGWLYLKKWRRERTTHRPKAAPLLNVVMVLCRWDEQDVNSVDFLLNYVEFGSRRLSPFECFMEQFLSQNFRVLLA